MRSNVLFLSLAMLFACTCCTDDEQIAVPPVVEAFANTDNEGMIVLGEKFENPYSIENMKAVYREMAQTRSGGEDVTIEVTDWYVRFLPKDSTEYRILTEDLQLELFDYPLDHDVLTEGTGYHDPSIPEDQMTWQYTTVKPGFLFPAGIRYELLDECFIPRDEDTGDDDEEDAVTSRSGSTDFMRELEYRALEKVGYIKCLEKKELIPAGTRGLFSFLSGSKPKGYIRVYDTDLKKDVPVKGIKVRATSLVKWSSAYTDNDGCYSMGTKHYYGPLYSVTFENNQGFDVWGLTGPLTGSAIYLMGFHNKKGYDRTFGKNAAAWEWATINNAAYDYYVNCKSNEDYPTYPPSGLKIWNLSLASKGAAPLLRRVYHPIGTNSTSVWTNIFTNIGIGATATLLRYVLHFSMPDVTIGTKGKASKDIYYLVSHELAHASHFRNVGSAYWAKYISYIITYGIIGDSPYGDGTGNNSGICAVGEMWGYAMGYIEKYEKYNGGVSSDVIYPGDKEVWFKPQILWDIYRDTVLTKREIFNCMTSDVKSVEQLKQKMISAYPQKADLIINKFKDYE
jgi:hypothetical protein